MSKNFAKKTEDFICQMCGTHVHGNGYTNHCPKCLTSKHVDINPGDRACDCHGLMLAIGLDNKNGELVLVQQCQKCGFTRRNKICEEDNQEAIRAVMNGTLPEYIEMVLKKGSN